jgi:hypothetical protein
MVMKTTSATAKMANMPTMSPTRAPVLSLVVLALALVEGADVLDAVSVKVVGDAVEDTVIVGGSRPEAVPVLLVSTTSEFEGPIEDAEKVTTPEGTICLR